MHRKYFPPCPVEGPIEPPVPFAHMLSRGAVPKKCSECQHLFEGECTRNIEELQSYLHLDHGPCGIDGPTDPVVYDTDVISSKVEVPRKCSTCVHVAVDSIYGIYCTKDADKWGDFHRGLDWGTWQPKYVHIQLPSPKVSTRDLSRHAYHGNLMAFVKEHRRINPGVSIDEAKADFKYFRAVIDNSG